MKIIQKILLLALLFSVETFANLAEDIMRKIDNNMRGSSLYMKMDMTITSKGHKRTMKMESWSKGDKKSFVKTLYPPKDKGITFLSLNNQMWQYIPKIERIIKIPPSMMLQNWMGSDITNDDMVKQSSLVDDYKGKVIGKKGSIVTLELTPKESSAVVWGKIISVINIKTYTAIKNIFYDEEGKKVRIFTYKKVKKFGKYYIPTFWKIQPYNKKSNSTQIRLRDIKYDSDISSVYFKKSALKRFSR